MSERWFVLPRLGDGSRGAPWRPDLKGAGVEAFAGQVVDFSDTTYDDLPWHPETMFVLRVYGTDTALDELASYDDVYGKVEHGISDAEAASYLNDRLGNDMTFAEYESAFLAGEASLS